MAKKKFLIDRMVNGLDKISGRVNELSLSDLEFLDFELAVVIEDVAEAIALKQVSTVYQGYAVDPILPEDFSVTQNDKRPPSHKFWWYRPYITTHQHNGKNVYWVECLDGGCWDRPTWWGEATTLEAAAEICRNGPNW